jgi:hypothetical protein
VAADYQMFLCKVLEAAIFLLSIKTIEESHKTFLETAMSICFFEIPQFREYFLQLIELKDGTHSEDYKLTSSMQGNPFFDWQNFVYDGIPSK